MTDRYRCELSPQQWLYIHQQQGYTTATLASSSDQQQQQSSHRFFTGVWTRSPQLYRLSGQVVVVITTSDQTHYLQVRGNQVATGPISHQLAQQLTTVMSESMEVSDMPDSDIPNIEPMPSMEPISSMPSMQMSKPGEPMSMTMGNMSMTMGSPSPTHSSPHKASQTVSHSVVHSNMSDDVRSASAHPVPPPVARQFCTQCGAATRPEDKFCGQCGHALT